jgi:hypothetical protein
VKSLHTIRSVKHHSFVGGLLTAMLTIGLLLMGSTSASALNTELVRPPVFSKARVTCDSDSGGVGVVAKLSNPNKTPQVYMVGIHAGDIYQNYVVNLAARGSEPVEFGGLFPDDTYRLQAQNADGDVVATAQVRVHCDLKPTSTPTETPTGTPTSTPTGTPTSTPSASPSETPTTSPATRTSSAVPSTPVAVPTAVDAGLSGPVAQADSNHRWAIAGLLSAVGIMIGLGSLLVRRRRGLHQL